MAISSALARRLGQPQLSSTAQDTGLTAVPRNPEAPVAPPEQSVVMPDQIEPAAAPADPAPAPDPALPAIDPGQTTAAPTQYTASAPADPAVPAVGLDTRALGGLDQVLAQTQQQGTQATTQNAGLKDILLQQLQGLSQPVSMNDPGLSGILGANRLTAQRTAERQRSALAERAATQGLSSSGALESGILGIEQQRGQNELTANSQVLGNELQQRRSSLQSLLTMALQLGDQESARAIQTQLQVLEQQLAQSNAYDDAGYRYAALQAQLNGQATNALLGGL